MVWELLGIPFLAGAARSFAGWLENSFEDGKVEKFEWALLLSSVLRVGLVALSLHLGLGLNGLEAAGLGVAADFGLAAVRKAGNE